MASSPAPAPAGSPTARLSTSSNDKCCTTSTRTATKVKTWRWKQPILSDPQAWKQAILSDPQNLTVYWVGSGVCGYIGVFSAPALDNRSERTSARIALNHGDIVGYLPEIWRCFT
ncbi:hypothetical protein Hdeb2414_s0001g00029661 [Helianthus debilis subsp. tardiflorus]